MRHRIAALAAAVVLLSPASSTAQRPGPIPSQCSELLIPHGVPFFWAVMNSTCEDLSQFIAPNVPGKTWTLSVPDLVIPGVHLSANGTFNAIVRFGRSEFARSQMKLSKTAILRTSPCYALQRAAPGVTAFAPVGEA